MKQETITKLLPEADDLNSDLYGIRVEPEKGKVVLGLDDIADRLSPWSARRVARALMLAAEMADPETAGHVKPASGGGIHVAHSCNMCGTPRGMIKLDPDY